jgi:hypothetical protein
MQDTHGSPCRSLNRPSSSTVPFFQPRSHPNGHPTALPGPASQSRVGGLVPCGGEESRRVVSVSRRGQHIGTSLARFLACTEVPLVAPGSLCCACLWCLWISTLCDNLDLSRSWVKHVLRTATPSPTHPPHPPPILHPSPTQLKLSGFLVKSHRNTAHGQATSAVMPQIRVVNVALKPLLQGVVTQHPTTPSPPHPTTPPLTPPGYTGTHIHTDTHPNHPTPRTRTHVG